jgi:hypothetical protein
MIQLLANRVILKDMHHSISIERVMAYCNNFGPVKNAWVHKPQRDKSHTSASSYAFVEFTHSSGVDTILAFAPHMISHRRVTIERAYRRTMTTHPSCHVLDTLSAIPSPAHQIPTLLSVPSPPPRQEFPLPIPLTGLTF